MNHVIEHIVNGIEIVEALSKKIKSGGRIYIETPSVKSLSAKPAGNTKFLR